MSDDERRSTYSYRGGAPEVVRLESARRSKPSSSVTSTTSSEMRPRPTSDAPAITIEPLAPLDPSLVAEATGASASSRPRQITPHSSALPAIASQAVDELMTHTPIDLEAIMPRIERLFEHTEPLLRERFPGPFWADPRRAQQPPKRGAEVSGIASALVRLRDRATPIVLAMLDSPRSDQRCAAAYVAGELPHPPLTEALGRLTLHDDPSSRLAAVVNLPRHVSGPAYASVVDRLRKAAAFGASSDARIRAIQALEELRDAGSVPALIAFLREPDAEITEVATDALRTLTARVLGTFRWSMWQRANDRRARFHWLIDALTQWDAELRGVASAELVRLTGIGRVLGKDATRAEAKGLEAHYLQYWADEMRQLGEDRT